MKKKIFRQGGGSPEDDRQRCRVGSLIWVLGAPHIFMIFPFLTLILIDIPLLIDKIYNINVDLFALRSLTR